MSDPLIAEALENADLVELGKRIRKYRKAMNLTQADLAVDVHSGYISRVETGDRRPSLKVLNHIAKTIDVEPAVLLGLLPEHEVVPVPRLPLTQRGQALAQVSALLVTGAVNGYIQHTDDGCPGALSKTAKADCTCGLAEWMDRLLAGVYAL